MELIAENCHQPSGELSTLESTKTKTQEARVGLGEAAHPQAPEAAVSHI